MTDQSSSTVSRKIRTLIPIPCSAWAATRSRNRVSTEYGDTGRAWRTRDYSDRTCDRECHLRRLGCTSSALADCPEAVVKALANRPFPLPHFARSWGRAFTGTRQVSLRSSGRLHRFTQQSRTWWKNLTDSVRKRFIHTADPVHHAIWGEVWRANVYWQTNENKWGLCWIERDKIVALVC